MRISFASFWSNVINAYTCCRLEKISKEMTLKQSHCPCLFLDIYELVQKVLFLKFGYSLDVFVRKNWASCFATISTI